MNNITIGNNVRKYRKIQQLTQIELSTALGYKSPTSIMMIETGQAEIPLGKVLDFALALNVSPVTLLGWENF